SLIQTIGRAARNAEGRVIMFADTVTESMQAAIDETERRRAKQTAYNEEHGITPRTVKKRIKDLREVAGFKTEVDPVLDDKPHVEIDGERFEKEDFPKLRESLRAQMKTAAADLDFEKAAELRDQIRLLEAVELGLEPPRPPSVSKSKGRGRSRGRTRGTRP
ncbi:MAG: UvrB/UvrC motif-containing protein, partial [Myxococcota bacterium]